MLQIYSMKPLSEFFSRTQQNASLGPPSTDDKSNRKIVTNEKKNTDNNILAVRKIIGNDVHRLKSERETDNNSRCVRALAEARTSPKSTERDRFFLFLLLSVFLFLQANESKLHINNIHSFSPIKY